MISCDTSLPRRFYEARRVSTAFSSGTLVLSVGQSDYKEVSTTDAVESQFFRHYLLLIHKVSCDSGYKKNRVSAPKSFDLGASETRFHPNLLLHYFLLKYQKRHTYLLTTWLPLPQARLGSTDKIFFLSIYYNRKELKSKFFTSRITTK